MDHYTITISFSEADEGNSIIKQNFINEKLIVNDVPSCQHGVNLIQKNEFLERIHGFYLVRLMIADDLTNAVIDELASIDVEPLKSVLFSLESARNADQKMFIVKPKNAQKTTIIDCTAGVSAELGCFMRDFFVVNLKAESHGNVY